MAILQTCRWELRSRRALLVGVIVAALTGCGDLSTGLPELFGLHNARRRALDAADHAQTHTLTLAARTHTLIDLGPATPGEAWRVFADVRGPTAARVTLALLDAELRLLDRGPASVDVTLNVVAFAPTDSLFLGVANDAQEPAEITATVVQQLDVGTPPPQEQVVYLNFSGANDVEIGHRTAISFAAFDAAALSPRYDGKSAILRATITRTLRARYADYNVTFISSDEQPPPADAHSTIHFGGRDDRRAGQADSVDRFNRNPSDAAIIYVENFSMYAGMRLSAEQMGQMMGEVAGHELGHLLGLYHVSGEDNLMDCALTAWDLVHGAGFAPAAADASVFPVGYEDSGWILQHTVGLRSAQTVSISETW